MKTILIILLIIAVIAGAVWVGTKFFGLAKDTDKDGIPDEVEDAIDDVKATAKEVKARAKNVKKELGDVVSALKGKPTKANLNRLTKQELIDIAAAEFDTELDPALTKSNLVNKVYALYNK
jgi:hypothetical protein